MRGFLSYGIYPGILELLKPLVWSLQINPADSLELPEMSDDQQMAYVMANIIQPLQIVLGSWRQNDISLSSVVKL